MKGVSCVRFVVAALIVAGAAAPSAQNWPMFRGPAASGVADGTPTPVKWDVGTGENVLWKTPVPGVAVSSPIVWGDRVFVSTAVSSDTDSGIRTGLYGDVEPAKDVSKHVWIPMLRTSVRSLIGNGDTRAAFRGRMKECSRSVPRTIGRWISSTLKKGTSSCLMRAYTPRDFRKHDQAERTGIQGLPGELQETEDGQVAGAGAQSTGRQLPARKASRAGSQSLASQA